MVVSLKQVGQFASASGEGSYTEDHDEDTKYFFKWITSTYVTIAYSGESGDNEVKWSNISVAICHFQIFFIIQPRRLALWCQLSEENP